MPLGELWVGPLTFPLRAVRQLELIIGAFQRQQEGGCQG